LGRGRPFFVGEPFYSETAMRAAYYEKLGSAGKVVVMLD
jgi:hypothetical protein